MSFLEYLKLNAAQVHTENNLLMSKENELILKAKSEIVCLLKSSFICFKRSGFLPFLQGRQPSCLLSYALIPF